MYPASAKYSISITLTLNFNTLFQSESLSLSPIISSDHLILYNPDQIKTIWHEMHNFPTLHLKYFSERVSIVFYVLIFSDEEPYFFLSKTSLLPLIYSQCYLFCILRKHSPTLVSILNISLSNGSFSSIFNSSG